MVKKWCLILTFTKASFLIYLKLSQHHISFKIFHIVSSSCPRFLCTNTFLKKNYYAEEFNNSFLELEQISSTKRLWVVYYTVTWATFKSKLKKIEKSCPEKILIFQETELSCPQETQWNFFKLSRPQKTFLYLL